MKSVAKCAKIDFLTKCQREHSEEGDIKLRRRSGGNIQGENSLKSSLNSMGNISPRER
jgi:hypothetical protein